MGSCVWSLSSPVPSHRHTSLPHRNTMKTLLPAFVLGAVLLSTQAGRVKKLNGVVGSTAELEKEETNKIHHGPTYKKALTDEEFARKKARYYKKLRLVGHRGEHRPANTRHDQDDLSLQDLTGQQDHQVRPANNKHKKTNFNKVMKLKSLKPNKKMKKMYKKLMAKEKMRLKEKHFKKDQKHLTP